MTQTEGIIIKGIGGFYYVEADGEVFECKARGIHRKNGITPLAGDKVSITVNDSGYCSIDEIKPRKNSLSRPPVANIDKLIIISSVSSPQVSTLVIDKMTAIAEHNGIDCVVVFSKSDLADCEKYLSIYRSAGYESFAVSTVTGDGLDKIRETVNNNTCAFSGNSGVGKSSIINACFPDMHLQTGEISEKLGRGRHTTRQAELLHCGNAYIIDTPGFASLDISGSELIMKDDLPLCFPEFSPFIGQCRFATCSHVSDKGCAVIDAVNRGVIPRSRHENYISLYNEVKDIKNWQIEKH